MSAYHVSFASPSYLALLLLLPLVWWYGYRRLAGIGRVRRWAALLFRTLVVVLLVAATADPQFVRSNDRLTVLFLLDQSLSIPEDQRAAMIKYVKDEVHAHRRDKDRAGVIVFGRAAAIELPPFDDDLQMGKSIECRPEDFDPQATNLAEAMKLAQATFPEDAARRIVLVTDGNQNQGNALEQAQALASAGIGIDIVPIRYHARAEVAVERVIVPPDVRRNQPFDVRVVLSNDCDVKPGDKGEVPGRLLITKIVDDQPVGPRYEEHVVLPPGKKVFNLRQTLDASNFYTYEAQFIPDRPEDDAMPQNNRASAFTHVAGKGQVLLIVSQERPLEYDQFAERLRQHGLEVVVRPTDRLFSTLAELQVYDTVVLANVPRASSDQVSFSDEQIDMLVRNTQQLGAGLVMLGGPDSFGAGGWNGTEMEKAMPVDFQIRNAQVAPKGALVLLMHASEIAQGNGIQKQIAKEAIKTLNPQDYCGVMQWNGVEQWIFGGGPVEIAQSRNKLLGAVDRMIPGDMPDFEPAMLLAEQGFIAVKNKGVSVMHMIVLSDGDPGPPSLATLGRLRALGVTISTVAVNAHGTAESQNLSNIATAGKGKYYSVNKPSSLPRIFQNEARKVSRSIIYDPGPSFPVTQVSESQLMSGISQLPPISGYVLTSKKENPLVETVLMATKPGGEDNTTILAGWNFGLGKAVAFTTDPSGHVANAAGTRWTPGWDGSPAADKLFAQIIRWSMRPSGGSGKFAATFEPLEGKMRVVVSALDEKNDFLNFLTMTGTAVGPDLKKPLDLQIEQIAPGRYAGTFPVGEAGSYFVAINPGGGMAPLRLGVNVPYSDEFRDRGANDALLSQLAVVTPKDGPPGEMIENKAEPGASDKLLQFNTFRHDLPKATSSQEAWHWLILLASCVFLGDVFIRRVNVNFAWLPPVLARTRDFILRRPPPTAQPQFIERLKSRKAEVTGHLEQLRASTRFELPAQGTSDVKPLEEPLLAPPEAKRPGPAPASAPEKKEEESYTERLLKAKKKAMEDRE
jgi:Mg-chelatase subunit ChlD/uncharacterized membrane protein